MWSRNLVKYQHTYPVLSTQEEHTHRLAGRVFARVVGVATVWRSVIATLVVLTDDSGRWCGWLCGLCWLWWWFLAWGSESTSSNECHHSEILCEVHVEEIGSF